MSIHLGFEPDAARARALDRRMHEELSGSLRYVVEQARDALDFDERGLLRIAEMIDEGSGVPPVVFARYYDLVQALMNGDPDKSKLLLDQLAGAKARAKSRSFFRLRNPARCERSAAYLEKFLEGDNEVSAQAPSPDTMPVFKARFERAMALMQKIAPELAGEVDAIVHEVVPIVNVPGKASQIDGGSHYQLWGALFLNADFHPTDEAMVEVITHESAHSLLFGLCTDEPLVKNEDDELFESPLRTDLRPMDGIYHATFVSARMHWVMSRLLDSDALDASRRDEVDQARLLDKKNFESGLKVVREHGRLTRLGDEVMEHAQAYMADA